MALMEKSKDFLKMLFFLVKLYYNGKELSFMTYIRPFHTKEGEERWEKRKKEVIKE